MLVKSGLIAEGIKAAAYSIKTLLMSDIFALCVILMWIAPVLGNTRGYSLTMGLNRIQSVLAWK